MDRAQDWGTRISHEASLHEAKAFLTLTYDDEHYPEDGSVSVREMQLFMKRVRKYSGDGVRFFACGEYGGASWRPHYHVLLFGQDFASDRYPWRISSTGFQQYRSPKLEQLWPFGFSEIGTVTVESAQYVARYVLKKVNGGAAPEHYRRVHPLTGEIVDLVPEFITMSTRPGLGAEWFERFKGDAFPKDFVTIEGKRKPIPRYYTKKLQAQEELDALLVKGRRAQRARCHADNNTRERLDVREEALAHRLAVKKRELES